MTTSRPISAAPRRAPAARPRWLRTQSLGLWLLLIYLSVFFLYPLCRVLVLSVSGPDGELSLGSFETVLFGASVMPVLGQTILTSVIVSIVCLLIAYPAAARIATLEGWKFTLCNLLTLFPFLSSSLVRTFVFIVLLGRNGVLNQMLKAVGVPGAPFKMLFNETGVIIGMSYVLLPYMLLSLLGSMRRMDRSLLRAALSLGASPATVFRTIYLPLTLPGVAVGVVITTILGFGYYVTPALMGGPRQTMIAQLVQQQISVSYNLREAAALAVVMLVIIAASYAVAGRWLGVSRLMRPE